MVALVRLPDPVRLVMAEFGAEGFLFDGRSMRYRDAATGRFVSHREMTALRDSVASFYQGQLRDAGAAFQSGGSVRSIAELATQNATVQYLLGRGGALAMQESDWRALAAINQGITGNIGGTSWALNPSAYTPEQVANYAGLWAGEGVKAHSMGFAAGLDIEFPAHPGDGGTACLGNCRCAWDVTVDADGRVEAYWRTNADGNVCEDCEARAQEYNPWVTDVGPGAAGSAEPEPGPGSPAAELPSESAVEAQGERSAQSASGCPEGDLDCRADEIKAASSAGPTNSLKMEQESREQRTVWSDDEYQAINTYLGTGYAPMNSLARGLPESDWPDHWTPEVVADMRAQADLLDNALVTKGIELQDNAVLYRGVANVNADYFRVGDVVTDNGFASTSLNSSVAGGFGQNGVVLEIMAPQGTRGIYTGPFDRLADADYALYESEFLLPRGSQIRVVEVVPEEALHAPHTRVRAELLLPDEYATRTRVSGAANPEDILAQMDAEWEDYWKSLSPEEKAEWLEPGYTLEDLE